MSNIVRAGPIQTARICSLLTWLELIFVDEAKFNEGMMADTFKRAARAGTKVFLFERDPVARPGFFAVREDVAELVRDRFARAAGR